MYLYLISVYIICYKNVVKTTSNVVSSNKIFQNMQKVHKFTYETNSQKCHSLIKNPLIIYGFCITGWVSYRESIRLFNII